MPAASQKSAAAALEAKQKILKAAKRKKKAIDARTSLLAFTEMTMPDAVDPDDVDLSRYEAATHHRAICEALEKVESGEITRLIITMPPRHGKSELVSKRFPTWFAGKNPGCQIIWSTYSQEFADDFGRASRELLRNPTYRQIFPGVTPKKGSQAANRMEVEYDEGADGMMVFVGAGGAITGRGADLLEIDDPFKNREEAESKTIRDSVWNWFTSTAFTRLMPGGRIVIVLTRWHEDDLVGRLANPEFVDPEEYAKWTVLSLPAVKDGKALWPERYDMKTLDSIRRTIGERDFSALYQQNPSPEDGTYFKVAGLSTYNSPADIPKNLRMYGASDHALTKKQDRDASVLGCVGLDENANIWIMPDLWWERQEPDVMVEAMIDKMSHHKPLIWFAEDEHIKKAVGPFLRQRMLERRTFCLIEGMTSSVDLVQRARSIQGMVAFNRVMFPRFAPWWPAARDEMLKFPNATHDDFVSFLSLIGRGLEREVAASRPGPEPKPEPSVGSIEWVKWASNLEKRARRFAAAAGGY